MTKLFESILAVINTGLSVVQDKTKDADQSQVKDRVKKGVMISSKRVLNLTGTPTLIGFGITWLSRCAGGNSACFWQGLAIIGVGIVYCAVMSWLQIKDKQTK